MPDENQPSASVPSPLVSPAPGATEPGPSTAEAAASPAPGPAPAPVDAGAAHAGAFDVAAAVARELGLPPASVAAVVGLLADGNTVPFIARYRKEATGALDEVQIRAIEERRQYLGELEERRSAVLASIREQGKLTDELAARIAAATGKSQLEDLYAPYRPRRRTRAMAARERGLEPLAARILAQPADGDPLAEAAALVDPAREVADAAAALAGARDIAAEVVADTAEVRAFVRQVFADDGELVSDVVPGKSGEPTKFEHYYAFRERVATIPSHRFLAIRRGEAEGVLRAQIAVDDARVLAGLDRLARRDPASPFAAALGEAIADAYRRLLAPAVENDVRAELKRRSDHGAVEVFADNLRNLLLTSPLGARAVIGVDPGLRTGCKCAALSATGKYLDTVTIFISQGEGQLAQAKAAFAQFVRTHQPAAIAVGNGTGGREAEAFVRKTLAAEGLTGIYVLAVNEAGASVYSASDLARAEFPELDLTIRGAISIARRLQDPLAELVKIEPKAIGVGQYQHDVHQPLLGKKLGDVVESCVNHVGVELNTASAQLLQYVAGVGPALAGKIVSYRDAHGGFTTRAQLMAVSGLGPKAFEQAAGFLRLRGGGHPLDASAVHPERYPLVEQIARDLEVEVGALIGNQELVDKIDLTRYVSAEVGEPTLRDIVAELAKPGRDPRSEFAPPAFREDVTALEDLKPGMTLEGVVTNVTAFGAFVDIGVHQDGLIHVSQLSSKFVKEPSEVVKVGQRLSVRVLDVDLPRKRIALSARPDGGGRGERGPHQGRRDGGGGPRPPRQDAGGGGPRPPRQDGGGGPRPPRQDAGGGGPRPPRQDGGGGGPRPPRQDAGRGGPRPPRQDGGGGGPRPPRQDAGGGGPRPPHQDAGGGGPRPPRHDGGSGGPRPPRQDGPGGGNRPPRQDGRGPRPGGPGPGPGGRTDGGWRGDGERRGDRGPRDDRRSDTRPDPREAAPAAGFGISGFVNNPFAKLVQGKDGK